MFLYNGIYYILAADFYGTAWRRLIQRNPLHPRLRRDLSTRCLEHGCRIN